MKWKFYWNFAHHKHRVFFVIIFLFKLTVLARISVWNFDPDVVDFITRSICRFFSVNTTKQILRKFLNFRNLITFSYLWLKGFISLKIWKIFFGSIIATGVPLAEFWVLLFLNKYFVVDFYSIFKRNLPQRLEFGNNGYPKSDRVDKAIME